MAQRHPQMGLQSEEEWSDAPKLGVVAQAVGALLSLALVIGVGMWAYKLIVRDVSGIPVIAASEGPMREAPENPGGKSAEHQGLSVNAVAEAEQVINPDQVTLAPRPTDLGSDALSPSGISTLVELNGGIGSTNSLGGTTSSDATNGVTQLNVADLANQIAGSDGISDQNGVAVEVIQKISVQNALLEALAEEGGEAVLSLRPRARPTDVLPASDLVEGQAIRDIAATAIPVGTALVQLGAFDSDALARSAWLRLSQKFPNIMIDRARVVQETKRGGRTFYRLRAEGFSDLNDARRFCAFLVASNEDCIPVTVR